MPADPAVRAADDYVTRVQRVMRTGRTGPIAPPVTPRWPRHRALAIEIPEVRIDLAEFIELHRCDAGRLLGARNGSLGRVMPASERLRYEIDIVQLLERCRVLRAIPDHPIHIWLARKRAALPRAFWNAVVAGPELAAAMSATQAANPPQVHFAPADRDAMVALHTLSKLRRSLNRVPLTPGPIDITGELDALRRGHFTGLLRAAALEARALDEVRAALQQGEPACPFARPTPRARTLRKVLTDVYGARFQPWLAETHRELGALRAAFADLAQATRDEQTKAFRSWYAAVFEEGIGARLDARISEHTKAWSELLSECAMLPGRDASRGRSAPTER